METDAGIFYQVKSVMDEFDIPSWIWQPIAKLESGFNPQAQNISEKEYSLGLYQINIAAHPEYSKRNLLDPAENARTIAELWSQRGVIEKARDLPKEQQAAYVWRYGSRPAWSSSLEQKVTSLSQEVIKDELLTDNNYYSDEYKKKWLELWGPIKVIDDYMGGPGGEDLIPQAPDFSPTAEPEGNWKTVIIRGLAYGLIFIFIFVLVLQMVKPSMAGEFKKALSEVTKTDAK